MIVLDTALSVTVTKFHRNLTRMKPIFNNLLAFILRKPSDETLEKLHAFKKSLMAFEIRWKCYKTFYCGNLLPFHSHAVILCFKATLPW